MFNTTNNGTITRNSWSTLLKFSNVQHAYEVLIGVKSWSTLLKFSNVQLGWHCIKANGCWSTLLKFSNVQLMKFSINQDILLEYPVKI